MVKKKLMAKAPFKKTIYRVDHFYDKKRVIDAIGKRTAEAQRRVGAWIRTSARRSIKFRALGKMTKDPDTNIRVYVKGKAARWRRHGDTTRGGKPRASYISRPGDPPFTHVAKNDAGQYSGLNIKMIEFAPEKLRKWPPPAMLIGPVGNFKKPAVPGSLEHGGPSMIYKPVRKFGRRRGKRMATIRQRPFMQPAMLKYKDKYPQQFRNALV